jgi:hypothetical protein
MLYTYEVRYDVTKNFKKILVFGEVPKAVVLLEDVTSSRLIIVASQSGKKIPLIKTASSSR